MSAGMGIAITVALLAVNAFFVAGEFAVTSTRRSQVEPLADEGARGTRDALYALQHVSLMLAICQLGVTVASTTLGVVAEPAIAHLVESPLERLGAPEATSHVIGFAAALIIVLFCHVVFGEMVPKNISIAAPVRMLLILAPILVRWATSCAPSSRPWTISRTGSSVCRVMSLARRFRPPTRSRRSPPSSSLPRPRVSSPTNWGCSAAPWNSQKKPRVRRWCPWPTSSFSLRVPPPPTWRNESLIPATRASRLRRGRCHRRLCPPQGRSLRVRRGTYPADYPVAHPPPRGRRLLRPG